MSHHASHRCLHGLFLAAALGALMLPLAVGGCNKTHVKEQPPAAPPAPAYTGPAYLRGTVGSMGRFRNIKPLPVSGFGVVAGLDGTGSRTVPAFLRQRLIQDMKKRGVGSVGSREEFPYTPEQFLDLESTAVVAVQGFIPPGATAGTRFDVLVSALPSTETTSLVGGRLFAMDLAPGGANAPGRYIQRLGEASGDIYTNPFDAQTERLPGHDFQTQALVVGGGRVTEDRITELVLNQASASRARAISDRINERFPMAPDDERDTTANPISTLVIKLYIPDRWKRNPDQFLSLIDRLYIGPPGFEPDQARRLVEELAADRTKANDVVLAWQAMGKSVLQVLREHYDDERLVVRMSALEAGAFLDDERASASLLELAGHDDPQVRVQVARALAYLPTSLRGSRALRQLLDDPQTLVRIAAYESLAANDDPIIDRFPVMDGENLKFLIDRVPAQRPLVYVTYHRMPRIVLFGEQLGFAPGMEAQLWDNRLMLRTPQTLGEAVVGLEPGGTAFVPIYGRGEIETIDGKSWRSKVVDALGHSATTRIESIELRDRFRDTIATSSDQPQAVAILRLNERKLVEATMTMQYDVDLLDLKEMDMVRPLTVYYQGLGQRKGTTYKIAPSVAMLAFMLGHRPSDELPQDGLALAYGDVVDALYHLCQSGDIPAPIEVDTTPMVRLLQRQQPTPEPPTRPETAADDVTEPVEAAGRPESMSRGAAPAP